MAASGPFTWHTVIPKYQAVCDSDIYNDDKKPHQPHQDWKNLYERLRTKQGNFYMVLGEEPTGKGSPERYITFLKSAVTKYPPSAGDEASSSAPPSNTHAKLAIYSTNRFQRSLEDHILFIPGHRIPCLQAMVNGQLSYTITGESFLLSKGEVKQAEKKFSDTRDFKWVLDGRECKPVDNDLYKVHLGGNSSDHLLLFREQNYSGIPKVYVLIGVFAHAELGTRDRHSKQSKTPVNKTGMTPKELAGAEMRAIISTFNIDKNTRQMKN